jgi:antitoxin VapB
MHRMSGIYNAMTAPVHARTFKSGNSEAVRLPKGIGFGVGKDIRVEREGGRVVLTEIVDSAERHQQMVQLYEDLVAIGAPTDGVQARNSFEFPERPGLG